MAFYDFQCEICDLVFEARTHYDKTGEYPDVICSCGSKKKQKLVSIPNLGHTASKLDNFGYRAGFNMNRAQGERRFAEEKSHMGQQPYNAIDDISHGRAFGEVQ